MQFVLSTPSSVAPGVSHHYQTIRSPTVFVHSDPLVKQRLKECENPEILNNSSSSKAVISKKITKNAGMAKKKNRKDILKPLSDEQRKCLQDTLNKYTKTKF